MRKRLIALIIALVVATSVAVALSAMRYEAIARVSSSSGITVEVRRFEHSSFALVAYWQEEPHACLEVRGLGGKDYRFFDYVQNFAVNEDRSWITVRLKGERARYWNFSAEIKLSKEMPGLIYLDVNATFFGKVLTGGKGFLYATDGKGGKPLGSIVSLAGWNFYPHTATYVRAPLVVVMRDLSDRYLFSVCLCDLSGKESVFNSSYAFDFSRDAFGIRTPDVAEFRGTLKAIRCFIYVWRNERSPESGLFEFLGYLADYASRRYPANNSAYIEGMLDSIERPKNVSDVFAIGEGRCLFKAYLGDPRSRVEEMEFITQANVLLGLSYLWNKTRSERVLRLMKFLLENVSYFDVFYSEEHGIYSNNWGYSEKHDSWYSIVNPTMLIVAHKLAPDVVKLNVTKLERHANWLIRLARKVGYVFPVFFYMNLTVEVPRKEADVALAYSYFMTLLYELTRNETYLSEAIKSLDTYMRESFGILYEAHLVAMGVCAACELYRLMSNNSFLEAAEKLCYLCACIMNFYRGTVIDEEVPFTLVSAMPNIYAAAFEYGLFKLFLEQACLALGSDAENSPVWMVYKFYSVCCAIVAKYAFPQVLGIEFRELEWGKIDPDYWIPVEDIYPVGSNHGELPQEIYGFGSQIIALLVEQP